MTATRVRHDLPIEGMTCAGCAARIQSTLSEVDGVVDANVNFATEHATVITTPDVTDAALAAAVTSIGYSVAEVADDRSTADALRTRFIVDIPQSGSDIRRDGLQQRSLQTDQIVPWQRASVLKS